MEDEPRINELIKLQIDRYNALREVNDCLSERTCQSISEAAAVAATEADRRFGEFMRTREIKRAVAEKIWDIIGKLFSPGTPANPVTDVLEEYKKTKGGGRRLRSTRNRKRRHNKKGKRTHRRLRSTGGRPRAYIARAKHVTVSYTMDSSADSIRIHAKFGDLTGVSAIHIHTNNHGKPGPIIAWLATTSEWKSGVFQNTPGNNAPCCGPNNPMCCLAGPTDSTPLIQSVANTEMDYVVRNDFCKAKSMCPWINNGTILVVHGFKFQRVENGCLTDAPAGIDPLQAIPFATSK